MLFKEWKAQTRARYSFFTKKLGLKVLLSRKMSPEALTIFQASKVERFEACLG